MWFDGWPDIWRILAVGTCAYAGLVVLLRISGKRTLSKMNAFDFIITIALGSTLATVLLSKGVALAEGLTALALLIGLQYLITWLSIRVRFVRRLSKASPTLLYYRGEFLESAMRQQRFHHEEILQAMRSQGQPAIEQVHAVVVETDGSLSCLPAPSQDSADVLQNVDGGELSSPASAH